MRKKNVLFEIIYFLLLRIRIRIQSKVVRIRNTGVMHTVELDSVVCVTPRVRIVQKCPFFLFLYLLRLSTPFFSENF